MAPLDFTLILLAARAVQQAWLRGSLFDRARARVQTWQSRWSDLLGCWFCLSYHVTYLALLVLYAPALLVRWYVSEEWGVVAAMPLYWLALSGALVTLNDFLDAVKGHLNDPDE